MYSEIAWRTLVVQKVGSPKKLDGAFVEVDALAAVNGDIPRWAITEGLPT